MPPLAIRREPPDSRRRASPRRSASLIGKGVEVYVVSDDLTERGLQSEELIDGIKMVRKADLPALCGGYDQVWHW